MRNLIRHILKEETVSVDPKKIKVLKKFIDNYFSDNEWYRGVDYEIGSWKSVYATPVPEIRFTIYISDEYDKVRKSDFSDLISEIDFLMDMFFPMEKYRHTAVWTMDVNLI